MTYHKKRCKKHDRLGTIMFLIVVIINMIICIDFIRFPECYLTTWKYQLKNEMTAGNQDMIDYYNNVYVKNNRILFE